MIDQEFKNFLFSLLEVVVQFNKDLKKGILTKIIEESNEIFYNYFMKVSFLNQITITDIKYGLNIKLSGLTGIFLFPSMLYFNSFRIQIIRQMKTFISKDFSLEKLGLFLSKISIRTQNVKKGGFTDSTLEVFRFYLLNFDKIMDNDLNKFLPILQNYQPRYYQLRQSTLKRKFNLTQKYAVYYLLPRFEHLGLSSIILRREDLNSDVYEEIQASLMGILFNEDQQKEFVFLFISDNHKFKNKIIKSVYFFENLDLFYKNEKIEKYRIKTENILQLYYNYKDNIFNDTAITYEMKFFNQRMFNNQIEDLDLLIHIFNSRKLPSGYANHPLSKYLFSYRNKLANFFATTNYFIHIFEPKGKKISNISNLLVKLLRNSFSNGYIIEYKSGLLLSTFVYKEDLEREKQNLFEFFHSMKLEIMIYNNLNIVPFSFYQIPNSNYFENEKNTWSLPNYIDQEIDQLMKYQLINYEKERKRIENEQFKKRVNDYIENWSKEIQSLKES